jgi:hypothetical protein
VQPLDASRVASSVSLSGKNSAAVVMAFSGFGMIPLFEICVATGIILPFEVIRNKNGRPVEPAFDKLRCVRLPAILASATAAATASATTAISAASAAAAVATAAAILAGLRFINLQLAAVNLFSVEFFDSFLALFLGRHFDKTESA